jgi:hypothetical protein
MTAPDHRPYAAPTDLVTAEDVLAWLDTLHKGPPAERIFGVQDAVAALDARIDRERRQACRRASFVALPELARLQRKRKFAVKRLWDYAVEDIDSLRRGHVRQALAFRAAARQP